MNDPTPFKIERLAGHDRKGFDCGAPALDQYLRTKVGQDVRRRVAGCFVAVDKAGCVAGFYTVAASAIVPTDLPEALARRLPRYASIPAYRIGRLAVDRRFQGRKLGAALLADAFIRVSTADAAGYALVADAKDERAADFYRRHGFIEFSGHPLSLFLPLATGRAALS